jgi:DNA-binding SARP family transcriptional activator
MALTVEQAVEQAVAAALDPAAVDPAGAALDVLLSLGTLLGRERRFAEAGETFARLVAYDPLLEAAHRGLMRCHAALGNRGRAVHQYHELVRLLDAQVGAPPDAETTRLYQRLRRDDPAGVAAA